MKKLMVTSALAAMLLGVVGTAQAAEVGGNVKTNVKAGIILQDNKGIANKNEANIGSVTGKTTSVGGNVKSNVKVGAVIQTNKGIANKNEVNIGSVTD